MTRNYGVVGAARDQENYHEVSDEAKAIAYGDNPGIKKEKKKGKKEKRREKKKKEEKKRKKKETKEKEHLSSFSEVL